MKYSVLGVFYKELMSKLMDIMFLNEYSKELFVYSILRMMDEGLFDSFND